MVLYEFKLFLMRMLINNFDVLNSVTNRIFELLISDIV